MSSPEENNHQCPALPEAIADRVREEGFVEGLAAGKKAGYEAGKLDERERIGLAVAHALNSAPDTRLTETMLVKIIRPKGESAFCKSP